MTAPARPRPRPPCKRRWCDDAAECCSKAVVAGGTGATTTALTNNCLEVEECVETAKTGGAASVSTRCDLPSPWRRAVPVGLVIARRIDDAGSLGAPTGKRAAAAVATDPA